MRELKFRAFDHIDNVMLFADIYEMQEIKGEWTAWELPADSPTNTGTPFDIMQFTGLKDKNGVDIYEGDILEEMRLLHNGPCYRNVEVKYVAPSFKVKELSLCNYAGIEWKVIGNIHENPELIKDK